MPTKSSSTQENVHVAGIKDGVVILKNGQYRIILSVSAVNFDLKSEQEQNSIIFNYQSFLNSLHFPIEIVISSKRLDLTPYLNKIKKLSATQTNELLKIQTEDYIDFVSQLINMANIMKKSFYAVVGHQPLNVGGGGIFDKLFSKKKDDSNQLRVSEEDFNRYAGELRQRATTVAQGLGSIGLHCRQLNTEEIIELLYGIYNPEVASKERLSGEAENFSSAFVTQTQGEENPDTPKDEIPEGEITIDNTEIVNAQHKKLQDERKQEMEKNAEKNIKAPEQTPPSTQGTPPELQKEQPAVAKVDLNAIQSIPATPQMGESVHPKKNVAGTMTDDVKEPIAQPAQTTATPVQNWGAEADADKSIKDPKANKDFGW